MTATIYGIRNCDTMKRARAWLDERGVDYTFHDYRRDGIDAQRLTSWCRDVGWEKLLNRAGTTFRKLPEDEKNELDRRKAIRLMQTRPAMIKRPVLEIGSRVVVGFTPETYDAAIRGE